MHPSKQRNKPRVTRKRNIVRFNCNWERKHLSIVADGIVVSAVIAVALLALAYIKLHP